MTTTGSHADWITQSAAKVKNSFNYSMFGVYRSSTVPVESSFICQGNLSSIRSAPPPPPLSPRLHNSLSSTLKGRALRSGTVGNTTESQVCVFVSVQCLHMRAPPVSNITSSTSANHNYKQPTNNMKGSHALRVYYAYFKCLVWNYVSE